MLRALRMLHMASGNQGQFQSTLATYNTKLGLYKRVRICRKHKRYGLCQQNNNTSAFDAKACQPVAATLRCLLPTYRHRPPTLCCHNRTLCHRLPTLRCHQPTRRHRQSTLCCQYPTLHGRPPFVAILGPVAIACRPGIAFTYRYIAATCSHIPRCLKKKKTGTKACVV